MISGVFELPYLYILRYPVASTLMVLYQSWLIVMPVSLLTLYTSMQSFVPPDVYMLDEKAFIELGIA